jgi:hypothetical protein
MITADKSMIIETTNVVISNGSGNSGTVGTGEAVEVGIEEGDDVSEPPKVINAISLLSRCIFSL